MMFFNFSQFFANQGPNAFYEEFLKTEELTLEQILDHEDTVTEVKKSNAGLLAILLPRIPDLIKYISKDPSSDATEKEGHRYPFISCEILTSEAILNEFMRNSSLLPLLFEFLNSQSRLNLTLVGYCASLSQRVLERQNLRVVDFLFQEDADYTPLLLRHIHNRAIAEFVVNILLVNSQFAARQKLLQGAVLLLSPDADRGTVVNVTFALLEVIRRSADVGDWRNLISTLLSQVVLDRFAGIITTEGAGDQVATVLTSLMQHNFFDDIVTCVAALSSEEFSLSTALRPILVSALECLNAPAKTELLDTSYGKSAPLGQLKLSLVQLVNTCIRVLGADIDDLLCEKNYVSVVTELFLAHPWNSILHLAYESLVRTTIEEASQTLKKELMERVDLVSVLANLGKTIASEPKDKHRLGFMGHITKISNVLLSASTTSPYIKQLLESDKWLQFAAAYLIPQNRVETSKYLDQGQKESEESPAEVVQDDGFLQSAEKDDENEEFEFKVDKPSFSPETLDSAGLFNFGNNEVSSDPEVEIEQGSDSYNDLNYWKLPINSEELESLE